MATQAAPPIEIEGQYIPPQRVVLASVYPLDATVRIARRAPTQNFTVPKGTRDKPGILVVEDTWESGGTLDRPVNHRILAEYTAMHIVDDLTIRIWGVNPQDRAWPGIFRCAGDEPTKEEIQDAWECQQRYWRHRVQHARGLERDEKRKEIQAIDRLAAEQLGIEEAWVLGDSDSKKRCVWCSKLIPKDARKCPEPGCGAFQSQPDADAYAKMMGNGGESRPPEPLKPPISGNKT